ncbi:MAG: Abortive infection protein [Bacteroidetes bacterium]|nr:Abortive infection protein [Bacteroidota bacterium]
MIKGIFSNSSTLIKIIQFIMVVFLMLIISSAIVMVFFANDISSIENVKMIQLIQSVGILLLPPLIMAYLWSNKPAAYLHLDVFPDGRKILLVTVIMIVAVPFINLLSWLNQQMELPSFLSAIEAKMRASEDQINELTERILQVKGIGALLFNVLLVAIIPALSEEFFFRGAVLKLLSGKNKYVLSIWITAIIFSAIHMQFYGFVPRMLFGVFFGYLVLWSGSLWLPVIAHFVNNVVSVLFYYLIFNGVSLPGFDTIGSGDTLWLGIVSGVLTAAGIVWFYQKNVKAI